MYVSTCPDCGKARYVNRRTARAVASRRYPGQQMNAYRCGDYWHIGHLPNAIKHGVLPRSTMRIPQADTP